MCVKHPSSIALIEFCFSYILLVCQFACACLPLPVGHGLHEMRVKLVAVT